MKRISMLIILITFTLSPIFLLAQKVVVKGKVFDNITNELLPGVSVVVKEIPGTGTVTDVKGEFSISVQDGLTLQFSFIRFDRCCGQGFNRRTEENTNCQYKSGFTGESSWSIYSKQSRTRF